MYSRLNYDLTNCSIARTVEILGERWTFLVLREIWFGVGRFSDLQDVLGIARNLLTERLRMLVAEGVLATEPYKEPGDRVRHRYVLTDKGKEVLPVLIALREWGDRYLTGPEGPPTNLRHKSCGNDVFLQLRCAGGHDVAHADEVEPVAGPGARVRVPAQPAEAS
jgi:DNA-binding HxlR family transcriptional regulator